MLCADIPLCQRKCNYCDFCSYTDIDSATRERYIRALTAEISEYKREEKIAIDTIFFGGGTPSLLTPDELESIAKSIRESFEVSSDAEFTVEVNPKTVTPEKVAAFKSAGVNRISIGMQTIHENELKKLGRIHNFDDFLTSYKMIVDAGITNISVDLMYGIPEQTVESFDKTLDFLIDLSPNHISAYGLILEENTPFWDVRESLDLPSEDEEYEMYSLALSKLSARGYTHYEISNYAKGGFESRHNLKYWRNLEYIGVGVAAHSYFENRRYGNPANIGEYLSKCREHYNTSELIDKDSFAYEYAMLGLRLKEGISLSKYKSLSGVDLLSERGDVIDRYVRKGLVSLDADTLALTDEGFYLSNTIITDLI